MPRERALHLERAQTERRALRVAERAPVRAVQGALIHVHVVRAAAHLHDQAQLALARGKQLIRGGIGPHLALGAVGRPAALTLVGVRGRGLRSVRGVRGVFGVRVLQTVHKRAALPRGQTLRTHAAVAAAPAHRAPHVVVQAVPRQRRHVECVSHASCAQLYLAPPTSQLTGRPRRSSSLTSRASSWKMWQRPADSSCPVTNPPGPCHAKTGIS